ncbi:MAG: hypothetical protein K0R27_2311 [Xanthobacteraceae bacterium]|jgi:hypothetical protein|nr:hypothetical protein [Xanthobacteraceae bacterium]
MRILALFVAALALSPAPTARAQDKPDPTVLAAAYQLANADGDRVCPMTLKPDPAGAAFAVAFDKAACGEAIPFAGDVVAWTPGPGDSIRLLGTKGALIAEFTEGVGGSWEALREGDGVYFLTNPSLADAKQTQPGDLYGGWDASRTAGQPVCRMEFTDESTDDGSFRLALSAGCDVGIVRFAPLAWRIERGDLVLANAKGETLRFALQEEGGWAKVPESNRPLLLTRPDAPPDAPNVSSEPPPEDPAPSMGTGP